jgi:hypothetical protein
MLCWGYGQDRRAIGAERVGWRRRTIGYRADLGRGSGRLEVVIVVS